MLQLTARRLGARRAHLAQTTLGSQRRTHVTKIKLLDDLAVRGLVADVTRPDKLEEHLESRKRTVYLGVDPTAPSLHVGHLIPFMVLLHFQLRGHTALSLIGGATALVGDPSGRTEERIKVDPAVTESHMHRLSKHVTTVLKNGLAYARSRQTMTGAPIYPAHVMNNQDWLKDLGLLDFLQSAGAHVRLNTMLARESVRSRLESQKGVSFTEFTYQLLQAYDFLWLFKNKECTIQVGGSDQWGNILSGLEMINRENNGPSTDLKVAEEGFGLTTPLLTTASGQKFGKSAGNAVWLDEKMTSVFDFYQFFLRTTDADVERQLLSFTFLRVEDIQAIMVEHINAPERRKAQKLLADEVTCMVHGQSGLDSAHTITKIIFAGGNYQSLKANDIIVAFKGDSRLAMVNETEMHSKNIGDLVVSHKLVQSKMEATRLASAKGLYLNNKIVGKTYNKITPDDLIDGRVAILRTGKSKHLILALEQ